MIYPKYGSKALKAINGKQCQETGELIGKALLTLMDKVSHSKSKPVMVRSRQQPTSFHRIGSLVRASGATSTSEITLLIYGHM